MYRIAISSISCLNYVYYNRLKVINGNNIKDNHKFPLDDIADIFLIGSMPIPPVKTRRLGYSVSTFLYLCYL